MGHQNGVIHTQSLGIGNPLAFLIGQNPSQSLCAVEVVLVASALLETGQETLSADCHSVLGVRNLDKLANRVAAPQTVLAVMAVRTIGYLGVDALDRHQAFQIVRGGSIGIDLLALAPALDDDGLTRRLYPLLFVGVPIQGDSGIGVGRCVRVNLAGILIKLLNKFRSIQHNSVVPRAIIRMVPEIRGGGTEILVAEIVRTGGVISRIRTTLYLNFHITESRCFSGFYREL